MYVCALVHVHILNESVFQRKKMINIFPNSENAESSQQNSHSNIHIHTHMHAYTHVHTHMHSKPLRGEVKNELKQQKPRTREALC